ncbi:MFS transporter [Crossiella sp. SN42]|uniref:MFS transporter n=1 Tax=Crossiella sp. SN42 TaxID=2944808 RepID=UPI00207C33FD|nr:MFS transporter [Crossiella sp. SN42]MCO1581397.1 MFS transporter [Crossiella sp. SN42]
MTSTIPDALAEPVQRVRAGWITALAVGMAGVWAVHSGPVQVLLLVQAEQFAPAHKEGLFGLTTAVGGLFGMVATILVGFASDRTTSRFGRRRPWVLASAVLGALSLLALAGAGSAAVMILAWCGVQTAFGGMLAALLAAIPDRVPVAQRGLVGGWVGLGQTVGALVGALVATTVKPAFSGYLVLAVLLLACALPFTLRTAEPVLRPDQRPPGGLAEVLRGFAISPRRHPDFAWALLNRLLVTLGFVLGTLYTLFLLQDVLHRVDPHADLLLLNLLNAAIMVPASVLAGGLSDRAGKRRVFIFVAALMVTLSSAMLVVTISWPVLVISAAVLAASYGAFVAVDTALLTEVLPAAEHRAKDLGIVNLAHGLPQVIAPLLATPILAGFGGYPGLFAVSAALSLIGAFVIFKIRRVP